MHEDRLDHILKLPNIPRPTILLHAFHGFLVGLLAFTVKWGWLRDWYVGVPQWIIMLVNPGTLMALVFAGVSTWVGRRTQSVRMAALTLFTMLLVGFIILTCMGTFFRGPNWDFFWSESQWPTGH